MSSEKNTDAEMLIQKGYKLKIPQLMHQPVVIAVDVNNSMNTMEAGQQKTNLKLIQDVINQIGQDSELKEEDKKTIDLCVMTFSDDDGMEGWLPLSEYHGGTTRNKTEFHDVVKKSLNAVRTIKKIYTMQGILCKCPLVFIITDRDTDPKYNSSEVAEVKELCERYVDTNKVALDVILLPGGTASGVEQLSSKVKIYKVDDCTYELSVVKEFINASMKHRSGPCPIGVQSQDFWNPWISQPVGKISNENQCVADDADVCA